MPLDSVATSTDETDIEATTQATTKASGKSVSAKAGKAAGKPSSVVKTEKTPGLAAATKLAKAMGGKGAVSGDDETPATPAPKKAAKAKPEPEAGEDGSDDEPEDDEDQVEPDTEAADDEEEEVDEEDAAPDVTTQVQAFLELLAKRQGETEQPEAKAQPKEEVKPETKPEAKAEAKAEPKKAEAGELEIPDVDEEDLKRLKFDYPTVADAFTKLHRFAKSAGEQLKALGQIQETLGKIAPVVDHYSSAQIAQERTKVHTAIDTVAANLGLTKTYGASMKDAASNPARRQAREQLIAAARQFEAAAAPLGMRFNSLEEVLEAALKVARGVAPKPKGDVAKTLRLAGQTATPRTQAGKPAEAVDAEASAKSKIRRFFAS